MIPEGHFTKCDAVRAVWLAGHDPTRWHVAVGDWVALAVDIPGTPIYRTAPTFTCVTTDGTVPAGTVGTVIERYGSTPEDYDAQVKVNCDWIDPLSGVPYSAIVYLNHDMWLHPVPA